MFKEAGSLPVACTDEVLAAVMKLEEAYPELWVKRRTLVPLPVPQPAAAAAAAASAGAGGAGSGVPPETPPDGSGVPPAVPGASLAAEAGVAMSALPGLRCAVVAKYQLPWLTGVPSKCEMVLIKQTNGAEVVRLIAIHNPTSDNAKILAGEFLARGGPGSYVDATQNQCDDKAWCFNRLTDWNKDVAARASGAVVFRPSTANLEPADIKMETLDKIHARCSGGTDWKVYAHKVAFGNRGVSISPTNVKIMWVGATALPNDDQFSWMNAAAFVVPCMSATNTDKPSFAGMVRSAFIMSHTGTQLSPVDPGTPGSDGNDLCVFTRKIVVLKPGHLVIVG